MGKPSAPPAPDYEAAAVAQGAQNRETALVNNAANRVNQTTPWGTQSWTMRPGADPNNPQVGDYTQTVSLSPDQQQLLEGNNRVNQQMLGMAEQQLGRVNSTISSTPQYGNMPGWYASTGRVQGVQSGGQAQPAASVGGGVGGWAGAQSGGAMQPPAPQPTPGTGQALQGDYLAAIGRGEVADNRVAGFSAGPGTALARNDQGQLTTNAMRVGGGSAARPQGASGGQQADSYGMNGLGAPGGNSADMGFGGVQNTSGQGSGGGGGGGGSAGGGGAYSGRFGAGAVPGVVNDASRQRVEEALLSRLEPQYQQDEARLRNQLLSQGLEVGTPAYAAELDRLGRAQNDARMQAVLAGGQEESRQTQLNAQLQQQGFNQGLAGSQFDNQTRQQMLAEMMYMRNLPINELNALRTGTQVTAPQFGSYYTNNAQAAPVFEGAQAQGNYNMGAYQQQMSGYNGLMGGLASLGGAAIMSDRRLKTDLTPIGVHPSGVTRYSWKWKDGSGGSTGVMAQDLLFVRPDAVEVTDSGHLAVRYDKIGGQ